MDREYEKAYYKEMQEYLRKNETQCVQESEKNTMCTQRAFNKEETQCVTQDVFLSKKKYGLLLRQLEQWGTAFPKSICRIYGVQTVLKAVEYTKATPNVRNRGGYCLYMCRQLKGNFS